MTIRTVASGETFEVWLQATNDTITEINQASDSGAPGRLVRYDGLGGLAISTFSTDALGLQAGPTVNSIATIIDANANNYSIATSKAILDFISSGSAEIVDMVGDTKMIVDAITGAKVIVKGTEIVTATSNTLSVSANTTFSQDVHVIGNLKVEGDNVSIATTELTVEDQVVTFNKGNQNGSPDGSGFEIEGASSTIVSSLLYNDGGFDLTANTNSVRFVPSVASLTVNFDQDLSTVSNVHFSSVNVADTFFVPKETATPASGTIGQIHFNTTDGTFEGYDGSNWGSLGGVSTPDKQTQIVADPVAKNLQFKANNVAVATFTDSTIGITGELSVSGSTAVTGNLTATGETFLHDNVMIDGDVSANGSIVALGSNAITLRDYSLNLNQDVTGIANTVSADDQTVPTSNAVFNAIDAVAGQVSSLDLAVIQDVVANTSVRTAGNTISVDVESVPVARITSASSTFENDVVLKANLVVLGTQTILDVAEVGVQDKNIMLNKGGSPVTAFDSGISVANTNAHFQLLDQDTWHISGHSNTGQLEATGALILKVDGVDAMAANTAYASFAGLSEGVILPTSNSAGATAEGTIRFNSDDQQFQGYFGGTWQGLGGVITPDKATSIVATTDHQLQFQANNISVANIVEDHAEIKTPKITLFGSALTGIATSVSSDGSMLPTSLAVNSAITTVKTNLENSIASKVEVATLTGELLLKANSPGSIPTASDKYLAWDGSDFEERTIQESFGVPTTSSNNNSVLKWNHVNKEFELAAVSAVTSVDGANITTPSSATSTNEVLTWTGNSFSNIPSNFATNAYVDGKMPANTTASGHALRWDGGAFQDMQLNFVDAATLTARFPSANTPDGYIVRWRQDLNRLESIDGFATKQNVLDFFPGGGAPGSGASGTQVTKWTGSQFENVPLSSVSVSSVGFSNSLTPQVAATSTEALQWDGDKFVHANFANTDYVDQEVSTRATQAWVTTQIDFKASQTEVDALKIDKADTDDVNLALGRKLDKTSSFQNPSTETTAGHYLIWSGSQFIEREMATGIATPADPTASNQVVKFTPDASGGGTFENINIADVQVSSADANNVLPLDESGTTSVIQFRDGKFENISGFATEAFVNSKLPLAYSNTNQALVWTGSGFRNKDLNYVLANTLTEVLPQAATPTGYALVFDHANNRFKTTNEFAQSSEVAAYFPAADEQTLSNQTLKWSGSELYNANLSQVTVSPEEANNVVPGEDSGTYSVIQWRNDVFENVDGLFAKQVDYLSLKDTSTTKSYVDMTFATKTDSAAVAASVTNKATVQYVDQKANEKPAKPVVDFANNAHHYLRWDGDKFVAEGFTKPFNTPANSTEDNQVVRWTGSNFVNANISNVEVSSADANNVVPGTKTSNTGTVQWTGSKFVNKDGFATEDYVIGKLPTAAHSSTVGTEVLKWTGIGFAKANLASQFVSPSQLTAKFPGSGDSTDNEVLQWRSGQIVALSAPFAAQSDIDILTAQLDGSTEDNQVVKWTGSQFEHANVAEVIITSQGFDTSLTPMNDSSRSQALQWKDGVFKHATFVTNTDLSNAVNGLASTNYVVAQLTGYTDTDDMNTALGLKVNVADYNTDRQSIVTKPAGATPDNFYLYWDGGSLQSREIVFDINTPRSSEGAEVIRWDAATSSFYNAELSTAGYEADANIVTPTMKTANNEILVWTGSKFDNRTGMATVDFVNKKFLGSNTADVTQVNQALAWTGAGFQNKNLDDTFATQDYVMDRMPDVSTSNTQVLHWDNQQSKLVEYTGFATKKSIDALLPQGDPGPNQVLSWATDKFEYVTISTATIEASTFDANTFMPASASLSTQALQWNGSEFVHGNFANTTWVEDKLEEKVEQDFVTQGLSGKAEKNYVDNRLRAKANTADLTGLLSAKMNAPAFENSKMNHYLRMSSGQLIEEEFVSTIPTPADDSQSNQVIRWDNGAFVNANLSLTAVETTDANNVLPMFGSNLGDVIQWNSTNKKFENTSKFALKTFVTDMLPNNSVYTTTTQALGWRDGKAYVLDLEGEAGFVKKTYVDAFLPLDDSSNTQVIQMIDGRFTNTDEFARKDYVDDIKPERITQDNQRLKWTGYQFVNANLTSRVIEKESFDANTFMPDDASTSIQALQWNGSEFVHGSFANTEFVEDRLTDKAGVSYVNTELGKKADQSTAEALEQNKANKTWVEGQLQAKVQKPAQTSDNHYLAYDVDSGWVEIPAAEAVSTPTDETLDNQMVVWTGAGFENANISSVQVSSADANNVVPTSNTTSTGVVQWNGEKFVNKPGFATEAFVTSKLPQGTTLSNNVLRWSAAGKFVNAPVNFLSQEKLDEKFPGANTLSSDVLQYQGGKLVPVSGFAMLSDINDIKPEGGDSSATGVLKWAEGRLQHTSIAQGGINPATFNTTLTPDMFSVSSEALQWTDKGDGSGHFTHATFANASFVANKMAETSSAVKNYGDAKFATIDTVSAIQTSLSDAVTTGELATELGDFAAKPQDSLASGVTTYLYWDGASFASGELPAETPVPSANTEDGFVLAWDNYNRRFVNKEVAVTALNAEDVNNVAPGSTSNDDQALQWTRDANDKDSFTHRVFITPEKLALKLPQASESFTSADFDALQWNGTNFINRPLQFVKPQELRDRMPAGGSGATGVVVSDANGYLSNSNEFAKKDFVKAYLPENGDAPMTGTNQMLVWNGSALENVSKTEVELSQTNATSILPDDGSNTNQCVYWDSDLGKLQHREVANMNYVQTQIGNLDFTQIVDSNVSARIDGQSFKVTNDSGMVLSADTSMTEITSTVLQANEIKLSGAATQINEFASAVTNSATSLPTSQAVKTYVDAEVANMSGNLSSSSIQFGAGASDSKVTTTSTAVEIRPENVNVISATKSAIRMWQPVTFDRDVTLNANLHITGTTTSVNTVDLDVQDKNITLNKGNGSGTENGAGLTVEAEGVEVASIKLDGSTNSWMLQSNNGDANISAASGQIFGVNVEGASQFEISDSTTSVRNGLDVTGAATLNSATSINDTLQVSGASTLNNKLTVATGGVEVTGAAIFNNAITSNADVSTTGNLSVDGTSTLTGAVTAQDTLTVELGSTLKGAVNAQNSLSVGGTATFVQSVHAQDALTVDTTSTLTGAVTAQDTLTVDGASTLTGAVTAQDALTVDGASTLTGEVSLGAGLQIGATQRVDTISDDLNDIVTGGSTKLMTANAIAGKLAALSGDLDSVSQSLAGTTSVSNSNGGANISAVDGGGITLDSGTSDSSIIGNIGGTEVYRVDGTTFTVANNLTVGNDLVVSNSITEASAGALKTNVTSIDGALDKIMALRGVEFNWINNINGNKEYGLIAEDVAQVAPNLVSYEQEEAKGVKYSKMVSLLIEAMKEQQKEIDELKRKLN